MLINNDNIQALKEIEDNSIDSVVTDPPYGLSFMGKKWDYDVPSKELWLEVFRVLKPGGHLLSFGGSRTYHRLAVGIEDAGFEIRDQIMWVYGSGFPKSHNIGKAVDKLQGNERTPYERPDFVARSNKIEQRDSQVPCGEKGKYTKGNSKWEGWGTALKPAHEPIVLARKPLSEKTVAKNVLKWGTGGINIDECRVGTFGGTEKIDTENCTESLGKYGNGLNGGKVSQIDMGRFPANFIHDGSDEVISMFPQTKSGYMNSKLHTRTSTESPNGIYGKFNIPENFETYGDSGSASRFFYCAKASKSERNAGLDGFEEKYNELIKQLPDGFVSSYGNIRNKPLPKANHHPTVKPIALMRYLSRLITPKNGIVLDPFIGSGTTGIACKLEGFEFVGIEIDKEYFEIAKARIENTNPNNHI